MNTFSSCGNCGLVTESNKPRTITEFSALVPEDSAHNSVDCVSKENIDNHHDPCLNRYCL